MPSHTHATALHTHATALATRAGFADATLRPLTLGRSSRCWTIHTKKPHAPPLAIIKIPIGSKAKVGAEVRALNWLYAHGTTHIPHVLAYDTQGMVLSWLHPNAINLEQFLRRNPSRPHKISHDLGTWLKRMHSICATPTSGVKRSSDPMKLGDRLARQLGDAQRRLERVAHREHVDLSKDLARIQHTQRAIATWWAKDQPVDNQLMHMVHRDLCPSNILVHEHTGAFIGVVDFERAAAGPCAWDFAKLQWWILDVGICDANTFFNAYGDHMEATTLRVFRLFEAATMLAYFALKHPVYPKEARAQIDADLVDGCTRPSWRTPI